MSVHRLVRIATHAQRHYSSMQIIKNVTDLRSWRRQQLKSDGTVGLVPTMGALHRGHLDLVSRSSKENASTVVSIFVNPSQFAPGEDLDSYPRTLESDLEKLNALEGSKDVVVFLPSVKDMYPTGITIERDEQKGAFVEVKGLGEQLEGSIRPQFFRGVATVVTKLLNAVGPEKAYFGQKDLQQSVVVKRLVQDLLIPTEIVVVPTAREDSGLAMSSRNAYLSANIREKSKVLYQALKAGEEAYRNGERDRDAILGPIFKTLEAAKTDEFPIVVEYIALSDLENLQEVSTVTSETGISAAVRVPNSTGGQTRLIDNLILN